MRFCYWRDPLLLFSTVLYFLNRFLLKPHFDIPFLHDHLNLNSAIHLTTDNTDTTDGGVYENEPLFFPSPIR